MPGGSLGTAGCRRMPWDAIGCHGVPQGSVGTAGCRMVPRDAIGCRGAPWAALGTTECHGVKQGAVGCPRALRGAIGCHGVPLGTTGCPGHCQVPWGTAGHRSRARPAPSHHYPNSDLPPGTPMKGGFVQPPAAPGRRRGLSPAPAFPPSPPSIAGPPNHPPPHPRPGPVSPSQPQHLQNPSGAAAKHRGRGGGQRMDRQTWCHHTAAAR